MNIYEYGVQELENRGMFNSQAVEVMKKVVADSFENSESINKEFKDRWNDNVDDYPQQCMVLVFLGIEPIALEYIKENCPQAWFRPIFDKDHLLRKEFEESQKREA